jgi:hypothetical protein
MTYLRQINCQMMFFEKEKYRRLLITIGENSMNKKMTRKVDITDYQDMADCIRSDQVPANEIAEIFTDKPFYKWYKKKYLNSN